MSVSSSKLRRSSALALTFALALLVAASAPALPKVGSARPSIKLTDGWDRELDLTNLGKPLIAIYEDNADGNTNQAIKDDLVALDRTTHYRKAVLQIYVIDLTPYNYWPARGLAKNELQKWSNRMNTIMYVDFTDSARQAFSFTKAQSNVVLYAKDGSVLFAYAGPMPEAKRKELVDLVRPLAPPP